MKMEQKICGKAICKSEPSRFGLVLRQLRTAKGISGRRLAQLANLASASVSQYETGRQVPRLSVISRLARVFGISSEVLSWYAYTQPAMAAQDARLFREVEKLMRRQVEIHERGLRRE